MPNGQNPLFGGQEGRQMTPPPIERQPSMPMSYLTALLQALRSFMTPRSLPSPPRPFDPRQP